MSFLFRTLTELRKTNIGFVMSASPHGTVRQQPNGFSKSMMMYFSKICRENSFHPTGITVALHENVRTFMIFRSVLPSNVKCLNSNTQFTFNTFFVPSKNRAVCEIMWKGMVQPDRPQMTTQYGACALHAEYLRVQTHTQNITCSYSTATVVTRTRITVT